MTVVYIDEEYGYRYWKATVDMTEPQIAEWWASLPKVEDPMIKTLFPNIVQISQDDFKSVNVTFAFIHCNDDSWLRLSNGAEVYHAGYGEYPDSEEE
jgi:hypothetical protein